MSVWTPEKLAELRRLKASGLSNSQIAKAMGVATKNMIIGACNRYGIAMPKKFRDAKAETLAKELRVRAEREMIVRQGWADGKTTAQIADEIGIHRAGVYVIAKRLGIEFQRQPEARVVARRMEGEALKKATRPALFTAPIEDAVHGIGIMELTSRTCKYPLWADDAAVSQLYCGQPVDVIGSWCPHHRLVATSLSNKEGGGKNRLWKPPGTARTAWS